jgi:hypothetical protein
VNSSELQRAWRVVVSSSDDGKRGELERGASSGRGGRERGGARFYREQEGEWKGRQGEGVHGASAVFKCR